MVSWYIIGYLLLGIITSFIWLLDTEGKTTARQSIVAIFGWSVIVPVWLFTAVIKNFASWRFKHYIRDGKISGVELKALEHITEKRRSYTQFIFKLAFMSPKLYRELVHATAIHYNKFYY